MQIIDRRRIRLRVYERGAGDTLACGTGACAAGVAGAGIADVQTGTERSLLLNLVSEYERELHLMRGWIVSDLASLYLRSGVPWRNRGYTSWPGVAGDMLEYTKPGTLPKC